MKTLLLIAAVLVVAVYARQGFGPEDQEWGFVEVREKAHIFYWLYYTTANVQNVTQKPLVIWLQGGPGASSTGYGNFAELGPRDVNLKQRNTSWVKSANILFVDNPVGTGFSYVEDDSAFATNNQQIAEDFVQFLVGFYQDNPIMVESDLYIFCESYGGKMTAEIALNIYKAVENGVLDINFRGIGLGDSWISPIDSVMTWAPYLLETGIVDQTGYEAIQTSANLTLKAIEAGKWPESSDLWDDTEMIIDTVTFGVDFYNILKKIERAGRRGFVPARPEATLRDEDDSKINKLMNTQVRDALGILRSWGFQSGQVFDKLAGDFMKPVTSIVEELLNTTNIIVAVYNGQLDLIVDTPGTVKWVDALQWEGSSIWKEADRQPMVVDNIIEGYVKGVGNLCFYWVNRSGHMVPADNPGAMDYILQKVITRKC